MISSRRCIVLFAPSSQSRSVVAAAARNEEYYLTADMPQKILRKVPATNLKHTSTSRWFASSSNGDLPYHIIVGMPALSPTMSSGTISKWNVAEGDTFSAGDSLAVIETDKASMDFEAQDDGIVAKLLVGAGGGVELEVGSAIMVTVEESNHVGAFANFVAPSCAASAAAPAASSSPAPPTTATAASPPPSAPAKDLPYHIVVGMPALSPTMDAGTISKWNVAVGDSFSAGDSIAVIETDKASMDFEAQDDGVVAKLLVDAGAGESISVGTPIMVTVEDAGDVPAFTDFVVGGNSSSSAASESNSVAEVSKPMPAAVATTPAPVTSVAAAAAPTISAAPSTPAAAAVVSAPVASMHASLIAGGVHSWGRLAAEKSPLARALAKSQQQYIDKYGSTGHIPI
jgi:pyruvate dehydrogenase E2 component (dihydrolipoamide acetyltransferase)